ncbi:MAG: phosphoenolpyruvate synthase [Acetatifactor sp.]|nr:phosphoenolpyruvate synthase [Acetatifactor sp.]
MATFDRVLSGISDMDIMLDNIRLGDNIVWRVISLEDFKIFLKPYVSQAISDNRNVIYVRFASHEALLEEQEGLKIIPVELSHRFESFTIEIHNLIEREGSGTLYVFDCLSELQTAWATDLMMENFFKVTCPFLSGLDTVAYFPILRGKHSFKTKATIRDISQLFLDVYSDAGEIYVRPLKVWNRYSETMFLPHLYDQARGSLEPLTDGIKVSRFYQVINKTLTLSDDQNTDSWDRFFYLTEQKFKAGADITDECNRMCDIMISRDEKMQSLAKANFTPEDYFDVRRRMIGTGMIGGKACGMLLARKLIRNNNTDLFNKLVPHDSFYIGSDVFYSYIVYNNFWDIRVRQRNPEEYFTLADTLANCFRTGKFPDMIREEFLRLLDYYGHSPIIVRSSSILEDGFGNAFAGKYESVFCANNGSLEERLEEFENAIRIVYASTMSKSALDYLQRRGLETKDEQMAILVQRVSGSRYKNLFMPCAAGVGSSYSPYRFSKDTDPEAGMLRLVMGLGTGAVDSSADVYPRIVSLSNPTVGGDHQLTQSNVDVFDTASGEIKRISLSQIENKIPLHLKEQLLSHNSKTGRMLITCDGLVNNAELMDSMRELLKIIKNKYGYPVDIEFTINLSEKGDYVINLLECKPLQIAQNNEEIKMPENVAPNKIFLECRNTSMGLSKKVKLDYIVMVNPLAYYNTRYDRKPEIAAALEKINWHFRSTDSHLMLLVPGKIGTSSPSLGVPASFSAISTYDAICEIAESRGGYLPAYGSHIFQDMVEAGIIYGAIFENEQTLAFHSEKVSGLRNMIDEICLYNREIMSVVGVYDVRDKNCLLYHDMEAEHLLCTIE